MMKSVRSMLAGLMAVFFVACAMGPSVGRAGEAEPTYAERLFSGDRVLALNIEIPEADWADLLANATEEKYYRCDVEIDGVRFPDVGLRTKGNISLRNIFEDPDSDRYGLKIKFNKYNKSQTCDGLDKLVLNNFYADATRLKEALVWQLFQTLGAEASLWTFVRVSVNGGYWGLYLALEAVDESFLCRNYGPAHGELYKPDLSEDTVKTAPTVSSSAAAVQPAEPRARFSKTASICAGVVSLEPRP